MSKSCRKRLALCLCLCLLCTLLPMFHALADPYPSQVCATIIDENTVLVTWQDNYFAQSYRVYRNNEFVDEVGEDVNFYRDTDLTPVTPYSYIICSVVDGEEFASEVNDSSCVAPMNTPEITNIEFVPSSNADFICVHLSWTAVNHATDYVVFAMEEGELVSLGDLLDTDITVGEFKPTESTTYRYMIRAYYEFSDSRWYYSSYSDMKSITYEPLDLSRFKDLYFYEEVWPWPPWDKEWLGELLDVYGDPEKWPQGVIPGSKSLAGLAQHLSEGAALSKQEKQMVAALHPHGLALLLGAYTSPPDEETAGVLTRQLQGVSLLLDKQTPDLLEGDALTKYYGQLKELCGLVELEGTLIDTIDSLHPGFEVKFINTQDIIFSNLPGASSLLGGKVSHFSPTPSPTPEPTIVLWPGKFLTKPPLMATPTPAPIRKSPQKP